MKTIVITSILSILCISYLAKAHDYDIKDTNGNKKFELKDSVIRDNNWNKIGDIDKDGYVRDTNWNRIGKIEKKHK